MWTLSYMGDHVFNSLSKPVADHLWYGAAVLGLCPLIAVLGSRRPGSRVWTWFIQIPLLLVLEWPVFSLWLQGTEIRGLELESPHLVGYIMVLIMGVGNYFGTRFTFSGITYGSACSLLVISTSASCPWWLADRWSVRLWATCLMMLALMLIDRGNLKQPMKVDRFDRLWLDVFDTFGVVWGRRIQDRINIIAEKEDWPVRLALNGFTWSTSRSSESVRVATELRMEHAFRWLFRRFVDRSWVDKRLGSVAGESVDRVLPLDS